jgi:hypothetical protein
MAWASTQVSIAVLYVSFMASRAPTVAPSYTGIGGRTVRTFGVGDKVAMHQAWPNGPPRRVVATAWAFAYNSRRRRRTASDVGVVCGSKGVKRSCGRAENVVVTAVAQIASRPYEIF